MGKGDRKTRRGKLFAGTFGVRRPKKKKTGYVKPVPPIEIKKEKIPVTEEKPGVVEKVEKVDQPVTIEETARAEKIEKVEYPPKVKKRQERLKKQKKKKNHQQLRKR